MPTDRKTIAKLENFSSKQQEIDFLREVAESIPQDAYLASLFTPALLSWVEFQIKSDFMTDLFGSYTQHQDEKSQEINILHQKLVKAAEESERITKELDDAKRKLTSLQEELKEELSKRWEVEKQFMEIADELMSVESSKEESMQICDQKIIELKAKLYDANETIELLKRKN